MRESEMKIEMKTENKMIDEFQEKYKIEINYQQRKEILKLLNEYKEGKVKKKYMFQFISLYLIKDLVKKDKKWQNLARFSDKTNLKVD